MSINQDTLAAIIKESRLLTLENSGSYVSTLYANLHDAARDLELYLYPQAEQTQ